MSQAPTTYKAIQFVKRPEGRPTPDVFELQNKSLEKLGHGQFLVKNLYLSMDPALVGRMREESNYAENVELGETMHAYGIGQVIESNNSKVKVGEVRLGRFDMQEYSVQSDASDSRVVNLGVADPTWYLGPVGVSGATAYFGLYDIAKPRSGETIVVSAGASSVGSIVAQLAKMTGCRTVGIVSTESKAQETKAAYGYDAVVSYRNKSTAELESDLKKACPNGIDMYFDNTSGDISGALLDLYNDYARIVVCGRLGISHLNDTREDVGRRDNNVILAKRIRKQGFVILDYQSRMPEAVIKLSTLIRQGKLNIKVDIAEGIDNVSDAFFKMLDGKSDGKQLVKLGDINSAKDPAPRWVGSIVTSKHFPRDAIFRSAKRAAKLKNKRSA